MSKEMDEELELNGLIKHLEEAFSNMDGDYFCKVHGQAVESALAKLRQIYKPEPVQYVVEIKKDGNYYQAHIEGRILCALIYWTNNNDSDLASIKGMVPECLNKLRSILSLPLITIEQITFVEV